MSQPFRIVTEGFVSEVSFVAKPPLWQVSYVPKLADTGVRKVGGAGGALLAGEAETLDNAPMKKVLFLLGQLRDADIEWMIASGSRRQVRRGDVLIQEGRPVDALFLVLDGALEVSGTGVGGGSVSLGCGEVVGEVSFVDSRPPVATVKAAVDSVVLAIPREELASRLADDLEFAARFYRSLAIFLAHRLRNTGKRLGYGKEQPLDQDADYEDELSIEVLDSLSKAGRQFDLVLQRLLTG